MYMDYSIFSEIRPEGIFKNTFGFPKDDYYACFFFQASCYSSGYVT